MSSCRSALIGSLLAAAVASGAAAGFPGIGRSATPNEIAAWDIDVRPDFKGLPPGSGSVARGQALWEAQCASCHGVFGESNEVFQPLVGGTTNDDIQRGRVARLTDASFPGRTTMMKLSTLSTLWDYIRRAMPWNAPKSLQPDEVYAVTAYLLNLAGVVPEDFTLSDRNIAQVQQRLPNRHGMTTAHAMWPGTLSPRTPTDVRASPCMSNCQAEPKVASQLPEHARNAHGNLAEQNRGVGAQIGADTTRPSGAPRTLGTAAAPAGAGSAWSLAGRHGCTACHGIDAKLVGPGFREIARKHGGRGDAVPYLQAKIRTGGAGLWGDVPMPPQALSDADAQALAQWIATGAGR